MVGFYMDAPNDRVAWDRDGSLLTLVHSTNAVTMLDATARRTLNSEGSDRLSYATNNGYYMVAVVFPEPMDCTSVFLAGSTDITWVLETSKDTTNGLDGTWSYQEKTSVLSVVAPSPAYRVRSNLWDLLPNSFSSDLRGIRIRRTSSPASDFSLSAFHIYGRPSALASTDRLAFWLPTVDARIPSYYFDWGNVPQSSTADKSFRIKNLSDDLVASDIDLYVESLFPGSPSVAGMHTLSMDGGSTFHPSLNLPALEPGELSDVLILRRVVPNNAQTSTWSARVAADVNLWESA